MRNRLIVGAIRYGGIATPDDFDHIESAHKRLARYSDDGNTEHLVDVANLMMVEFVSGIHPKKHFHATDRGE